MDPSEVEAIVDKHLPRLVETLRLTHWHITVNCTRHEETGAAGACDLGRAEYWKTDIWIDPAQHAAPAEVLETLVHELLHVLLAPLEHYRSVLVQWLPDEAAINVEDVASTHAVEQVVALIERGLARELRKLPEPEGGSDA